ncbi:ANTAR domain-containing response regulator [Massilia sp. DWR3-1-1]|uniref:ANTAR domain-containing response regulator n=1 Tax=Massilia sp. DWR3-1-1 TaxID=2804559 RepID=UPI003CFBBCB5
MTEALPVDPSRRLILLVDDDIHLLALLSKMLQMANYDVRIATSAPMALGMLADGGREPDLAILDIQMPGMSGLELAAHVRANSPVPFLFLSASDTDASVRSATEQGAVGYLVKPIELHQLLPTVIAGLARGDEIRSLRDNEERLGQALQTGRETGMAVGVLMERFRLDRETAFRMLRDQARSSQRKLNDVARELLDAGELLNSFNRRLPEPRK